MLINAYMDIKRKHIKIIAKNVNSSHLDYYFKRWYVTDIYNNLKLPDKIRCKLNNNSFYLNTFNTLNELKKDDLKNKNFQTYPKINNNKQNIINNENAYYYNIDNCLKYDQYQINKEKTEQDIHNSNYDYMNKNNPIYYIKNAKNNPINYKKINSYTNNINRYANCIFNNIININSNKKYLYQIQIKNNVCTLYNIKYARYDKRNVYPSKNVQNVYSNNKKIQEKKNFPHIETNINLDDVARDMKYATKYPKKKGFLSSIFVRKLSLFMNNLFEKHLLLMNCIIAGTLYFIADLTCQMMEVHKNNNVVEYDFLRTLRMALIGLTLEGPIMTWWYGKILANFIKSKPNTFLYKSFIPTLFDNFIFGPIHLTIFFFYNGILKNQRKSEIIDKIVNTGMKVFFISLMTWTPLTLINFVFVPRIYQATVVFFADFFWVIFLSWCANKK
ncbi:conserved Plasmodium membrane protein, unknown function [Plasmodium reichenowi]|uniref:Protein Mpv17 n=1 Tax=Plasmodium reichenowi TaxID=5854 RepID=A0A2P9D6U6_PLARE|nr:conserved Plasmodium membrane protein, unknown function [Plasmodium reichenowi]